MAEELNSGVDKAFLKLVDIGYYFSLVILAVIGLPVVADVVCRLVFKFSIIGVMDFAEVAMALMAFSSMAYVQARDAHIGVDLLTSKMSPRMQSFVAAFIWALAFGACIFVTYTVTESARETAASNAVTAVLAIPLSPIFWFCAFGMLLLSLSFLRSFIIAARGSLKHGSVIDIFFALALAAAIASLPLYLDYIAPEISRTGIGFMCFLIMFVLIFLGMPIGIAMTLMGTLGLFMVMPRVEPVINMLGNAPYHAVASFLFMVVPMFLMMGEFSLHTNLSKDMFDAMALWMGRTPGGLCAAAVCGCAGFAAICGESMATAATMASAAIPEMRAKGYEPAYCCAAIGCGGTLGILIPPSVGFIIYSIITEASVGDLFMAGVVPGLLLTAILVTVFILMAVRNPSLAPRGNAVPIIRKLTGSLGLVPMLTMILLVLGGILTGIFSPTEGGAIGAFLTFVYGLIRRLIGKKEAIASLKSTGIINGRLMMILIGVGIFGYFLAATRLPNNLAKIIMDLGMSKWAVLSSVIVLYLLLGCIMNVIPMMMLTLPAIFPTIVAVGLDPVWFGVLCVILMEMGQLTPPIGIIVFTMSSIVGDVPVQNIFVKIAPAFIGILVLIGLLLAFPDLALWLPNAFK